MTSERLESLDSALSVPSGGKTSQLSHGASEGARADGAASGAAPNFDPWTLAHIRVFGIPPISCGTVEGHGKDGGCVGGNGSTATVSQRRDDGLSRTTAPEGPSEYQASPTGKPSIFILSERKPLLKSKRGN